jgi:hypothetical protein
MIHVKEWLDLPQSIKYKVCTCAPTPYKVSPYGLNHFKKYCLKCFKPPVYLAYTCRKCELHFLKHGDTFFRHPRFCNIKPMCWTCCETMPEDEPYSCCHYCTASYEEASIGRRMEMIKKPPKRVEGVIDEDFDIFA